MCGNIIVDGNETVTKHKTVCPECASFIKMGIKIVACEEYKVGDYVLFKNDVLCCDYGVSDEMSTYYPNRIVRIEGIEYEYGETRIIVSMLDDYCRSRNYGWRWSENCFVGKVLGAKKSHIGMSIKDFAKEN